MGGEAGEVYGPEGEGDEEPVVDVPNLAGMARLGDFLSQGVELFDQGAAVLFAAEGEGGQVGEILFQDTGHGV